MLAQARSSFAARFLASTCLLGLWSGVHAQSTKISGDLALSPGSLGGDVEDARFSPDGSRIVYVADQDAVGERELYSVASDGSDGPTKLSTDAGLLTLSSFQIASDGARVVYQRHVGTQIYSVPLDGSAPPIVLGSADRYEITPDGAQVVLGDGNLSIVPIDGSAGATVIGLHGGSGVISLALTTDGTRAVYTVETCIQYCQNETFSVRLDGSQAPASIPGALWFQLSPDSSRVVFTAVAGLGTAALFSIPIDGSGSPVQLSAAYSSFFSFFHWQIDPTSQRVAYLAPGQLFSSPLDASSSPALLNNTGGTLVTAAYPEPPFQFTPDGTQVVYRADPLVPNRFELFTVPVAGGTVDRVSGPLVAGGDVYRFQVTADSQGVLFNADKTTDEVVELYGALLSGGTAKLSGSLCPGGNVSLFQISANQVHVVYFADQETNEVYELFAIPLTGGPGIPVSAEPIAEGDVRYWRWLVSPSSDRVAYLADQDVDESDELFCGPIVGGTPPVQLNDELEPGPPKGDVWSYQLAPDGSRAVYVAEGEEVEVLELYSVPVTGGSRVKLNGPLVAGGGVSQRPVITADGARVLYLAEEIVNDQWELFSVPIDGSQVPVRLSRPMPADGDVYGPFELSSDGAQVVYLERLASTANLLVVPTSGGTPLQLNPPSQDLYLNGDQPEFRISPDGSHAVYRSGVDVFGVRTDGSSPAVRLNRPFPAGSAIGTVDSTGPSFLISADGRRVVYAADATVDGRHELFSVPIEGRLAPVRLNGRLAPGGDVHEFAITATGERVVYYADQEADERFELFSVPITGAWHVRRTDDSAGAARVKLNGPLAPGGIVGYGWSGGRFVLSPDGSRVAFAAQPVDVFNRELYCVSSDGQGRVQLTQGAGSVGVPVFSPDGARLVFWSGPGQARVRSTLADGSSAPVALSTLHSNPIFSGGLRPFAISSDGGWVVFVDDPVLNDLYELFARPIDGSGSPLRLHAPLAGELDVGGRYGQAFDPTFAIAGDSGHVVYGADQDLDEVNELYSSPLPALP